MLHMSYNVKYDINSFLKSGFLNYFLNSIFQVAINNKLSGLFVNYFFKKSKTESRPEEMFQTEILVELVIKIVETHY
jgi:hypothetical protein